MARNRFASVVIATVAAASIALTVVISYAVLSRESLGDMQARQQPLPELYPAPPFSLTNREGGKLSTDDLRGKVWVADFFFTRCKLVCPALTGKMVQLNEAIHDAGLGGDVDLVSVSVDPDHDTPEVLRGYAKKYEAGANWHFLTGEAGPVRDMVIQGFKLPVQATPENELMPVQHSARLVLVDQSGMIRAYYQGLEAGVVDKVMNDIHRLVQK